MSEKKYRLGREPKPKRRSGLDDIFDGPNYGHRVRLGQGRAEPRKASRPSSQNETPRGEINESEDTENALGQFSSTDPYVVLGIPAESTVQEVKKAARALLLKHHPDYNPEDPNAKEISQAIIEAYRTIEATLK